MNKTITPSQIKHIKHIINKLLGEDGLTGSTLLSSFLLFSWKSSSVVSTSWGGDLLLLYIDSGHQTSGVDSPFFSILFLENRYFNRGFSV